MGVEEDTRMRVCHVVVFFFYKLLASLPWLINACVYVVFLFCICRPDTLDPALLRPGRLDRKVEFGLPDLEVRWSECRQLVTAAMSVVVGVCEGLLLAGGRERVRK